MDIPVGRLAYYHLQEQCLSRVSSAHARRELGGLGLLARFQRLPLSLSTGAPQAHAMTYHGLEFHMPKTCLVAGWGPDAWEPGQSSDRSACSDWQGSLRWNVEGSLKELGTWASSGHRSLCLQRREEESHVHFCQGKLSCKDSKRWGL
jgi:hypothetical protein